MTNQQIGFGLRGLTSDLVSELFSLGDQLRVQPDRNRPEEYNVSFWLKADKDYAWLVKFLEDHAIEPDDFGFTVSIVTEENSGVVRLPRWAAPLIRKTKGAIRFSYTFIMPCSEEEAEASGDMEGRKHA